MDVYIETVCSVDKTTAMSQALELNSPHTKERKHTDEVERIYSKIKVDVRHCSTLPLPSGKYRLLKGN